MAKKTEEVGAELLLNIIGTVDDDEKAAFDAIRRFVESVDSALPGGGKKNAPSRRVRLVEAALDMIEQLLGVSNDAATRLTNSVRQALPQFEAAARAAEKTAKKAPAKKVSAKKAAKKTPAKKAPAKKAAKKTPAKKAPGKKASAKKAPGKKASAKRPAKK